MATGDDGDARRPDATRAVPTRGMSETTRSPGWTVTSPGAVIAPATLAGDESMLREGDAVARYRIVAYLGRGGMGVVYKARDPDLDRELAIKLVRSRHRGGDRMLREAQAMARLDHPNVVPIFDVGMRDQQLFLVMPFVSGGTLREWCAAGPRPWSEVVRRYVAAGRGLEAAHRAGIVHRDFKPDNVLVTAKGDVQVADFGLARAYRDESSDGDSEIEALSGPLGHALTRAGELLGTPAYMAPEQLDRKVVDARADQFSFCVALHEALYGVRPFEVPQGGGLADIRGALAADRIRAPIPGRDVPSRLRDVLVRGLRNQPDLRWPSMTALLAELERGARRPRRATRAAIAVAIGGAVVAGAIAAASAFSASRSTSSSSRPDPPSPASDRVLRPRQLTARGDVEQAHLAPDDSAVLARAGGDLILVPLQPGGQPKALAKDVARFASFGWSPDATHAMTVTRVDQERSLVALIDVASGEREERELPVWTVAVLVGPREIASTLSNAKDVRITSFDGLDASRRCRIPGEFLWVRSLHAVAGALFVTVQHADDTLSVVRTDRHCTHPHVVVDHVSGRGLVTVDHDGTHVGVLQDTFAALVLERHPVKGGAATRSAPLPSDVTAIAGRTANGSVVVVRGTGTWKLVRMEGEPARITDVLGTGSTEVQLEVSPDGTRIARSDLRRQPLSVRVVPIGDLDALPAPVSPKLRDLAWSPDGTRLAGLAGHGDNSSLIIVPAAGGPAEVITLSPSTTGQFVWTDDQHVAYLRNDNRTFVSLDLATRKTLELLDPTVGWSFELAVNRRDGSLAVYWNRVGGAGLYVVSPGQRPERVTDPGEAPRYPAWSADGRTLWMYEPRGGGIDRYDLATRSRRRVVETMEPGTFIQGIWPQADGGLLVHISRTTADLVVHE